MPRVRWNPLTVMEEAGVEPAEVVPASLLVEMLGNTHPLFLPRDPEGEALSDFSQLTFFLHPLAEAESCPKLPINAAGLHRLCRRHRKKLGTHERWTYQFFYLELLAQEGRLKPLFWGHTLMLGLALHSARLREQYLGEARRASEHLREHCRQVWQEQAADWVERKAIAPPDDRPWLDRLQYLPQDLIEKPWNLPELPFSSCLQFRLQPYYDVVGAVDNLRRYMALEVWKTSVFNPWPVGPANEREWRAHLNRFALSYRRRTEQWERKRRFEEFVKSRHPQRSPQEIAQEAVNQRVWPYGTRKGGSDDRENCQRAVYRVLKALAQPGTAQPKPQGHSHSQRSAPVG